MKRKNSASQRRLLEAFEAIRDMVPDPPRGGWGAWIKLGQETELDAINHII